MTMYPVKDGPLVLSPPPVVAHTRDRMSPDVTDLLLHAIGEVKTDLKEDIAEIRDTMATKDDQEQIKESTEKMAASLDQYGERITALENRAIAEDARKEALDEEETAADDEIEERRRRKETRIGWIAGGIAALVSAIVNALMYRAHW
jgi:chromosome segregation ATPase